MGIYDRDYYRDRPPRGGFGNFSMASVTTTLIALNVAVFIVDALLFQQRLRTFGPQILQYPDYIRQAMGVPPTGPLEEFGYYSVDQAIHHLQLWRFVSYQFIHANLQHLFFNMLGLYFFGPIVESYLGPRRYLGFYLLCGCSGAVVYTLLYYLGPLAQPDGDIAPLVGASAGIYGVLVAAALLVPDVTIVLMFPPIPIQLKYLALGMVALAAYSAFNSGHNAGGEAAHLGGAALGYLLIRYPRALNLLDLPRARGQVRRRTAFRDWSRDPNH
jgi:membrane associated rhomboid family serine protease